MTNVAPARARTDRPPRPASETGADRIRWFRILPPLSIHLGCLGVIWVGWSWTAVGVAAAMYALRMFVITAFYHRYFSHRTFETSRVTQFIFALIGASSAQRGPLWWAAHHRKHHRESDLPPDPHSPRQRGVLWSHMGWYLSDSGVRTDMSLVPDLSKHRELVWLDRNHVVAPLGLATVMFGLGALLSRVAPSLGTDGAQMLVWGFFISTTVLHHATFTINSIAHTIGSQRYATHDDSRNNWVLALLTFGEGWHNNHHFNPGCVRQGFYWWEIDPAYYGLWMLEKLGVVWKLRPVPARVYETPHVVRGGAGGVGGAR